jgi:alpha-N-acetylglucosamine transferase
LMRMWSTRLYVDVTSVTQTLLSLNWYTVGFRFPWRKKEFNYNIFKAIWRCPWTFIEELCPSWQMLKEIDQLWQKFIAFF